MEELISQLVDNMEEDLINVRRNIHCFPEIGWTEFRTSSLIADFLSELGFEVKVGKEIIVPESRMGVPDEKTIQEAKDRAISFGANPYWIEKMEDGLTGVVGVWDTGRIGPTLAYRFDIDALEISEDKGTSHVPWNQNFSSKVEGWMHACGHDGHIAIGLGLAQLVSNMKEKLAGKIKLIFQPAEEGARGARAMVDAGVLEDVNYFFSGHIGVTATKQNQLVCSVTDFFASTKIDLELEGVQAHAALAPHEGRNAILAASTITLQLYAISRHGLGDSRVNVGVIQGGEGRNIIPGHAKLKFETRGTTNEVDQYMKDESLRIIQAAAQMYGVKEQTEVVGRSISAVCDSDLANLVYGIGSKVKQTSEIVISQPFLASEDVTYMMKRVQANGGMATYLLFGTELAAGHHNCAFDFNEKTIPFAVEVYGNILIHLAGY
ncbi:MULTISPECIES: amidohydrolase [unclassified Bacillus (in: firmicutes)]|uniref:amidohydrolase n=1 Tax=unclassified Bacillus (in: firmicutes) TaxID=185979 RepID=UPI001C54ED61|nr:MULTISPECIES: amidohydrolase [unclassified Bacillus (in: firmicutes)]